MAEMTNNMINNNINNSDLVAQRKAKLATWRMTGHAYPNDFRRDHLACDVQKLFESLSATDQVIHLAGRIMLKRIMGKAAFVHIQDMSGRIQIYVRQNDINDHHYQDFKTWDIGDIIGVTGKAFKTHTGEISVKASCMVLLTKSLQPLPDKFHGLHDQELCYRKRYVDLIMNEKTRQTFMMRSKIIEFIRDFLKQHDFLEVETPMMHVMAGGATAKPFVTHHHALDMALYLRIAPELYLKRLVIGGFEKVFEINRNFRNEGLSTRHNPEFTMVEFYQAYADYRDLMDLTEKLMRALVLAIRNTLVISYQQETYDFALPFERLSLLQAILKYNPDVSASDLANIKTIRLIAQKLGITVLPETGLGKIQLEIFEKTVEHQLKNPVFITEYPAEVSPLARRNDNNPFVTDRFEFFVGGREIANAFSELNDPEDQARRFADQVKKKQLGDQEAMNDDQEYIHALEHGLPPTAGEGIGIDRLVMLLTDSPSIKDVILFPHMRLKADNA